MKEVTLSLFGENELDSQYTMRRVWEMPNKWTFSMDCIKELFYRYEVGMFWADPFAGEYSPAEFTNDIEGRCAKSKMDALDFLKKLSNVSLKGVLFDPPYSVEQCLRKYTPKQNGTAGRAEYWSKCKDEIGRIVKPGGHTISFCWDSTGIEIIHIVESNNRFKCEDHFHKKFDSTRLNGEWFRLNDSAIKEVKAFATLNF